MSSKGFGRALAAIVVAGALSACGSSDPPAYTADDGSAVETSAPSVSGSPKAKKSPSAKSGKQRADQRAGGDSRSRGTGTTGSGTSEGGGNSAAPSVSCMNDYTGDQDRGGSVQSYSDLTRACVRESGSAVRFELTLASTAPSAMPDDDTVLALGFRLPRGDAGSSVQLDCDSAGWTAYLTHGQGRTTLPRPSVSGSRVMVTVPASKLPAAFAWQAQSTWTRSTLLSTSYAFDRAPDVSTATFRR